jgi:hypothetical protein
VKYGVIIPHCVKHAMELDTETGNTLWADAIKKEIDSHGQTEGYQLPINGSERHQHSIAGFNCAS